MEAASASLLDEIARHRDLSEAESGTLHPRPSRFTTGPLLAELCALAGHHAVATGRTLAVAPGSADVPIETDRVLLQRVLANLVKNALEAEPPGGGVTVACEKVGERVRFEVRNPSVMPRAAQVQIFQRSFSTKGAGRGLGTYSVRLLTERYLDGRVSFTSTAEDGTCFVAEYPAVLEMRAR